HLRCLDLLEQSAQLIGIIPADEGPRSPKTIGSALMRLYARSVGRNRAVEVAKRFANVPRIHADGGGELNQAGQLDFVLKLGRGRIPSGIKLAMRLGVWCFEHETPGDLLPFFQQVYDAEDVTETALLSFGSPGGDAAILEHGCFP